MHTTFKRMWLLPGVVAVAASALVFVAPALSAHKDGSTLVIWTDQDRQAAITQLANQWASGKGITVKAVVKDTGQAARARAFIGALVRGAGHDALARAGFLPPPRA